MEIKRINFKKIGAKELAALVCQQLADNKIRITLTGGGCVTIYSKGVYVSKDLDFVPADAELMPKIEVLLKDMGFEREGRHFLRNDCPFLIEFINPPLSIGDEKVREIAELKTNFGRLYILSPTDCVKDRLAAYFHWGDKQALAQAILVTKAKRIDQGQVRKWAGREGKLKEYGEYLKQT